MKKIPKRRRKTLATMRAEMPCRLEQNFIKKIDMFHVEHGNRCATFAVDAQERGLAQNVAFVGVKNASKKENVANVQKINSGDHSQKNAGGKERMRAEMPRRPRMNPSKQTWQKVHHQKKTISIRLMRRTS